ncbi:hypothetical protein GCM10009760_29610 [Kitasatospora kazusensis]|uniref:Uncharacterized protein n=1 Tax=Kitasatospora kazusensis TaxID=407974 RepID=A0ABN2ZJV3_9ACTN
MPRIARQYWGPRNGRNVLNFNWPGVIDSHSTVIVTAGEYARNDDPHAPHTDYPRFVGAADIRVCNISPHGDTPGDVGGVTFVVDVDWGAPLHIVTDIIVLDPPEDIEIQ